MKPGRALPKSNTRTQASLQETILLVGNLFHRNMGRQLLLKMNTGLGCRGASLYLSTQETEAGGSL